MYWALKRAWRRCLRHRINVPLSQNRAQSVASYLARQGVNPATGEKIQIKASKAAKFSPASGLKNELNG